MITIKAKKTGKLTGNFGTGVIVTCESGNHLVKLCEREPFEAEREEARARLYLRLSPGLRHPFQNPPHLPMLPSRIETRIAVARETSHQALSRKLGHPLCPVPDLPR